MSDVSLPVFTPGVPSDGGDQECPKCGWTRLQFVYQGEHPNAPEHLQLSCDRCGFTWRMAPADQAQETA